MIYKLEVPGPIEEVEEVRVLEWQRAPGSAYQPGDLMVELETHKAVIEVRAGQSGILRAILCQAGDWERIGRPLAILSDTADEPVPESLDDLSACKVTFEII